MKIDLTLNKRSKIASYRVLLKMFVDSGFSFFTHAHFFEHGAFDGKAMYLRHDADRNIEIALLMARIENNDRCRKAGCKYWAGDAEQCQATGTAAHCAFRRDDPLAASQCNQYLSHVSRVPGYGIWATYLDKYAQF